MSLLTGLLGLGNSSPNPVLFSNCLCFWNGQQLTQSTSAQVSRLSKPTPTYTVGAGYAGDVLGPTWLEIQVENAVPNSTWELDIGSLIATGSQGQLTLDAASSQLVCNGTIWQDAFVWGVEQVGRLSFHFRGQLVQWVPCPTPGLSLGISL